MSWCCSRLGPESGNVTLCVRHEGGCFVASLIPNTYCHVATLRTQPTTTPGHYTTCCKSQSYAPEDGQKVAQNMLSWFLEIYKSSLLHLVGLSMLHSFDPLRFLITTYCQLLTPSQLLETAPCLALQLYETHLTVTKQNLLNVEFTLTCLSYICSRISHTIQKRELIQTTIIYCFYCENWQLY